MKTQFGLSVNKVRGLLNASVYALLSVLCCVLNREAAENMGRPGGPWFVCWACPCGVFCLWALAGLAVGLVGLSGCFLFSPGGVIFVR